MAKNLNFLTQIWLLASIYWQLGKKYVKKHKYTYSKHLRLITFIFWVKWHLLVFSGCKEIASIFWGICLNFINLAPHNSIFIIKWSLLRWYNNHCQKFEVLVQKYTKNGQKPQFFDKILIISLNFLTIRK